MQFFPLKVGISLFLFLFNVAIILGQSETEKKVDFNALSIAFLKQARDNENTEDIRAVLSKTTIGALEEGLKNDNQKLAFWVNVYNAYIQVFVNRSGHWA